MIEYARQDYVAMEMLKSFVTGTIAFMLMFGIWAVRDIDRAMGMLNAAYLKDFIVDVGLKYLVFLLAYLIVTYVVYQIRYTQGRKKVKKYYNSLKAVNKMYEREEKLRTPSQD